MTGFHEPLRKNYFLSMFRKKPYFLSMLTGWNSISIPSLMMCSVCPDFTMGRLHIVPIGSHVSLPLLLPFPTLVSTSQHHALHSEDGGS